MNRRVVFSIIAGGIAAGAVLWIGGMAAAQIMETRQPTTAAVAGAAVPTPSITTPPHEDPTTPTRTPSPRNTDDREPAATDPDSTDFVPFADRLRAWRPGDTVVTLDQIHAFYAVPGRLNDADPTWYQEKAIMAQCMADKGWYYDPRSDGRLDASHRQDPRPPIDPKAQLALSGNTGAGDAYRWQDAGCDGLAVHETGNDHNN